MLSRRLWVVQSLFLRTPDIVTPSSLSNLVLPHSHPPSASTPVPSTSYTAPPLLTTPPTLPTTLPTQSTSLDHLSPLSSRSITPRKPHAGQQISQSVLRPHVAAADRLFTWDTPHAARHRHHLTTSLPSHLVNSALMSIRMVLMHLTQKPRMLLALSASPNFVIDGT
jgi:hypothetical protein